MGMHGCVRTPTVLDEEHLLTNERTKHKIGSGFDPAGLVLPVIGLS